MNESTTTVTIWNEFIHERERNDVREIYPAGIHEALHCSGLAPLLGDGFPIRTATLDQPEHGLEKSVLDSTDVLLWWGHMAHDQVDDAVVNRVHQRVLNGMGLIVLHSGHASKIFRQLMGTGCMLRWREAAETERIWVVDPSHPIAASVDGEYFEIPSAEMYGEFFDVPPPEELIFISWFQGGEVFRSGMTYRRGAGKIFYFRPGHELYPIYFQHQTLLILADAIRWATPMLNRQVYLGEARHIPDPISGQGS